MRLSLFLDYKRDLRLSLTTGAAVASSQIAYIQHRYGGSTIFKGGTIVFSSLCVFGAFRSVSPLTFELYSDQYAPIQSTVFASPKYDTMCLAHTNIQPIKSNKSRHTTDFTTNKINPASKSKWLTYRGNRPRHRFRSHRLHHPWRRGPRPNALRTSHLSERASP